MTDTALAGSAVPRIESLRVRNYRALKDLRFDGLRPLTVLIGPNGSGKSTVFDVFAFLSECFTVGLRKAWDKRGRFRELRTRGAEGPIVIELRYREHPDLPVIAYHLEIGEDAGPYVAREWLAWRRVPASAPGTYFRFLDFAHGNGTVATGDMPEATALRVDEKLDSREMLAVNTLGQFARHPRVGALRRFITGWHLSYLTADNTRGTPDAGPQEHLSTTGDNLPNVIQYLKEQHPERLADIQRVLALRVPRLEAVESELLADGRLLLQIKDVPFERPILSKYASDGTLKMLAYLTLLYDPQPPPLIGIEEPENQLYPHLLPELAEECRAATERTQLMVTTHSPYFLDGLRPEEAWVLERDQRGFTQVRRAADIAGVREFADSGAKLGWLWMRRHLAASDAPVRAGGQLTNGMGQAR